MLQVLRVTDYVLFGRLDIEFGDKLNVISGETGAGKSILLGAVELLLGGEASVRLIRAGAERAVVEGLFAVAGRGLARLKAEGLAGEDVEGEIAVRREVSSSGRSRCFINGALANLAMLRRLGQELIQVHGQHEHGLLTRPARQLELLDAFAGLEPAREDFAAFLSRYRSGRKRLADLEDSTERQRKERDLMHFQLEEIDRVSPSVGEEKELEEELSLLENAERVREIVSGLLEGLEGEGAGEVSGHDFSISGSLGVLRRQLGELVQITARAGPLERQFDEARYGLEEVAGALREILAGIDDDPARLEELRSRREELYRIKKKYGPTLDDVSVFREKIESLLEQAGREQSDLGALRMEQDKLSAGLEDAAQSLTVSRKQAAVRLEKEVCHRLEALAMQDGKFSVSFERVEEKEGGPRYLTSGADRINFLLSTNPGVALMPLSEVASGGELSRLMLAVQSAMAEVGKNSSCMIFDEVDSGIGGKVGGTVGLYLNQIAAKNQVLVVTHLAQIASYADNHLVVEKVPLGERNETLVRRLGKSERTQEIARMLAGDTESETSLAHARKLLEREKR